MRIVILVLLIVPLAISVGYLLTHPMPKDNVEALRQLLAGDEQARGAKGLGANGKMGEGKSADGSVTASSKADWRLHVFDRAPEPGDTTVPEGLHVRIETDKGAFTLELFERDAPRTVANFKALVAKGFYDGLRFHRVIPGFVVQGGDPKGDGTGGPGYHVKAEFNRHKHVTGAVGMALSRGRPDSAGSQFYIVFGDHPRLDGHYTIFAHVVEGMDVVERITKGTVIRKATVLP